MTMNEEDQKSKTYAPGPNAVDITPEKDGGVLKEIIKEGMGNETPATGHTVVVHYTGRLTDGTVFDSSVERGEKFQFQLGKGEVIKAWDMGVATMTKGEKAVLTCKPEYAYGESGSPPKIPENATLVFEVELFDWKMEDLTSKKDGGVLRKIIHSGQGSTTPNEGASVEVHLTGKYNGVVFEERDLAFPLGEGSEYGVVEGLEIALEKFKKGEKSIINLKPKYAFGSEGKAEFNIPPNAEVQYEVEMKNFEKAKQSWEMDSDEKLEQSEVVKTKGTDYFKAGKYSMAIKQYKKIVSFLEFEKYDEEERKKQCETLLLAAHLNLAMCYLKVDNNKEAISSCDKALEKDPNNVKGFFRRGQARMGLKDYDIAKEDFEMVLKLDNNNKAARNQIVLCNNKIKEYKQREKNTYRNMFEKFAEQDAIRDKHKGKAEEKGVWNADGDKEIQDEMADEEHDDVSLTENE
ncbi:peptidyl-prolyl cis-trans isomerase FKBP4-like [Tachypleus tridentatus]|uniref:peptidyl-prolyl cis-trans isomerase FKBP4-like n=1 Tax=Tachypleus tridentatus TaxID=6853 RepID=UPI003FD5DBBF